MRTLGSDHVFSVYPSHGPLLRLVSVASGVVIAVSLRRPERLSDDLAVLLEEPVRVVFVVPLLEVVFLNPVPVDVENLIIESRPSRLYGFDRSGNVLGNPVEVSGFSIYDAYVPVGRKCDDDGFGAIGEHAFHSKDGFDVQNLAFPDVSSGLRIS